MVAIPERFNNFLRRVIEFKVVGKPVNFILLQNIFLHNLTRSLHCAESNGRIHWTIPEVLVVIEAFVGCASTATDVMHNCSQIEFCLYKYIKYLRSLEFRVLAI